MKTASENFWKKFNFTSFDRSRITFDQSSETKTSWKISSHVLIDRNLFWINRMFLFDRSTSNRKSIKLDRTYVMIFFIFSIDRKLLSIYRMFFFDLSNGGVLPQRFSPFINKSPMSNLFSATFNLVGDLFVLPRLLHVI